MPLDFHLLLARMKGLSPADIERIEFDRWLALELKRPQLEQYEKEENRS